MVIVGYPSATSFKPGESVQLQLSLEGTTQSRLDTTLDIQNLADPTISTRLAVSIRVQPVSGDAPWEGYRWRPTTSFRIPSNWPSGLYRIYHREEGVAKNLMSFVVKPDRPGQQARVLVNISYLTSLAYTTAGGKSFYEPRNEDGPVERARKISFDRPWLYFPMTEGPTQDMPRNEAKLLRWLAEQGIGFECCSGVDLHREASLLQNYDCLVLAYHDEYWTKSMRDKAERFVRNGGNIICLSGNTCFRQLRLEDNDRTAVFYKYAGLDPYLDVNTDEVTVAWADPPVNRPPNDLLGIGFTHGAYSLEPGIQKPYDIRYPGHWVFAGVSQTQTSPFIHYETDATGYVEEEEGYPRVTGEERTPLNLTILATADLRDWPNKPGRATMAIFSRGGTVFNGGCTEWVNALDKDPVISKITENVFSKLARPIPWNWELVGRANKATAMSALDGVLYLADTNKELSRRFPVGEYVPWKTIGHANHVTAMASSDGHLFCVSSDNFLWARTAIHADVNWIRIGKGPDDGTRALAAAGGFLYAIDQGGHLHRRAAIITTREVFHKLDTFEPNPEIVAMTSYSDILIASTSTDRLLRSNRDFIAESNRWHDLHHCENSVGLAVVDWMLYVATSQDGLWRIDLTSLARP